ncbi:Peptide deformylase, partial [hydrothermal vent metagenome]
MSFNLLKIRQYGDPCLRQKAETVSVVGPGERMLIQSMIATMNEAKGIGLAAPQVGISKRIFVADVGDGPIAVIDPKILAKSGSDIFEEGCLSIPN